MQRDHLGSDWDSDADTDPIAAIHALRRDLRRLEKRVEELEQARDRDESYQREQNERL